MDMERLTLRKTVLVAVIGGLALAGAAGFWPARSAAGPNDPHVIKLFEAGKVVAQWTAENEGRMDGDSFVFTVRKGVSAGTVRIRGTFTAEPAQ